MQIKLCLSCKLRQNYKPKVSNLILYTSNINYTHLSILTIYQSSIKIIYYYVSWYYGHYELQKLRLSDLQNFI